MRMSCHLSRPQTASEALPCGRQMRWPADDPCARACSHTRVFVCGCQRQRARANDARLEVVNGQRRLVVGDGAVKVALPAVHVMILSRLTEQQACLPSG